MTDKGGASPGQVLASSVPANPASACVVVDEIGHDNDRCDLYCPGWYTADGKDLWCYCQCHPWRQVGSSTRGEAVLMDKRDAMVMAVEEIIDDPATPEWALKLLLGLEHMDRQELEAAHRTIVDVQAIMTGTADHDVEHWAQHEDMPLWARGALTAFVESKRGFARFRAWADVELMRRVTHTECLARGYTS